MVDNVAAWRVPRGTTQPTSMLKDLLVVSEVVLCHEGPELPNLAPSDK